MLADVALLGLALWAQLDFSTIDDGLDVEFDPGDYDEFFPFELLPPESSPSPSLSDPRSHSNYLQVPLKSI